MLAKNVMTTRLTFKHALSLTSIASILNWPNNSGHLLRAI